MQRLMQFLFLISSLQIRRVLIEPRSEHQISAKIQLRHLCFTVSESSATGLARFRGTVVLKKINQGVFCATVALLLSSLLTTDVHARPEGTRTFQINQGLLSETPVRVFARTGEDIRFCSSDDGHNETGHLYGNCLGRSEDCAARESDAPPWRIDDDRDHAYPVRGGRLGAEILLYPPTPMPCDAASPCALEEMSCRAPDGGPFAPGRDATGRCGIAFGVESRVDPTSPGVRLPVAGFCSAFLRPEERVWHSHIATEEGHWTLDFVGERYTIEGQQGDAYARRYSTRFFEVDVRDAMGAEVPGGRVNAFAWNLTSHAQSYPTSADFFVVRGDHVYVMDLDRMAGQVYAIVSTALGLPGRNRASQCVFGDAVDGVCPVGLDALVPNAPPGEHPIYLNYPDPRPADAANLIMGEVTFTNENGTPTLSPDADGIEDQGVFEFQASEGTFAITIDTNGDGQLNDDEDRVLTGPVAAGMPTVVPWDGADAWGLPVLGGDIAFGSGSSLTKPTSPWGT